MGDIWNVPGYVVRVVDGDTIVADLDLGWKMWKKDQHIRLLGINAPEMNLAEGKEAKAYLQAFLSPNDRIIVASHSIDSFGRVLGDVTLCNFDATNLSHLMVESGHAVWKVY